LPWLWFSYVLLLVDGCHWQLWTREWDNHKVAFVDRTGGYIHIPNAQHIFYITQDFPVRFKDLTGTIESENIRQC